MIPFAAIVPLPPTLLRAVNIVTPDIGCYFAKKVARRVSLGSSVFG
jgi:hypothetical protein